MATQRCIRDYFQSTSISESSLNDDSDGDNANLASYAEDDVHNFGGEEDNETCFLDDESGIIDDFLCVNTKKALNKRPDGMHTAMQKDDTC